MANSYNCSVLQKLQFSRHLLIRAQKQLVKLIPIPCSHGLIYNRLQVDGLNRKQNSKPVFETIIHFSSMNRSNKKRGTLLPLLPCQLVNNHSRYINLIIFRPLKATPVWIKLPGLI
jgi:hypothetical protein